MPIDKPEVSTNQPSTGKVNNLQTAGFTAFELAHILGIEKLSEYVQPIAARIGQAGGPVMDKDISGHVHTHF